MKGIEFFWNTIKSWADDNAKHYVRAEIPRDRTDLTGTDEPLIPFKSYFRLWLADMFLSKARTWFVDQYPAVHTSVALKFGAAAIKICHVTNGSDEVGRGAFNDYAFTDLLPFSGGTVEIQSALIALKGTNYLKESIGILKDFSSLVAAPLNQTLDIADKVSSGLQNLFTGGRGGVSLAFHKQYVAAGAGGGNVELKPGYIALVSATADQIPEERLSVKKSQLLFAPKGGKPAPLEGYDYMLLRIEGRAERDNWRMPNIEEPLNQAIRETLLGNTEKAKEYKTAALLVVYQSPDLTVVDRRRVAHAIEAELADIASEGASLAGRKRRSLDAIVKTWGKQAPEQPLTFREIVNG